ncbi:helix-turn-helix domain-containing protein [Metabacillus schmidteae]|uniref:helix-turn-helix domain-containing protein n=1 Tax=Metabacillus schmidteae TaxID=2730405 RepID=UPI00158AB31D|nr:hypothetical protein [Metabacillus schmidteae]
MINKIISIPIKKIIYDKSSYRINLDNSSLFQDIGVNGLKDPLKVEGPNENEEYFLIKGYRRIDAINQIRKQNPNRFNTVDCFLVGNISSNINRNIERLGESLHSKRMIGSEKQFIIEETLASGLSDKELARRLNVDVATIRRYKKGTEVPKELRLEFARYRASQEALRVIYNLDVVPELYEILLENLREGLITTVHSDAIKKISKDPLFKELDTNGQEESINEAIKSAKFTEEHAQKINYKIAINENPHLFNDLINNWIKDVNKELEILSNSINPEVSKYVNEFDKQKIKRSLNDLNRKLKWVYGEKTKKDGYQYRFTEEDTNNGG